MSSTNKIGNSSAVSANVLATLNAALNQSQDQDSGVFAGLLAPAPQTNGNTQSNAQSDNSNANPDNSQPNLNNSKKVPLATVVKLLRHEVRTSQKKNRPDAKNAPDATNGSAPQVAAPSNPPPPNQNGQNSSSSTSDTSSPQQGAQQAGSSTQGQNNSSNDPQQNPAPAVASANDPQAAQDPQQQAQNNGNGLFISISATTLIDPSATVPVTTPVQTDPKIELTNSDGISQSQLMAMLVQLEKLASQDPQQNSSQITTPTDPTTQSTDPTSLTQAPATAALDNVLPATDPSGDKPQKIDLKALMAALNTINGNGPQTANSSGTDDSSNTDSNPALTAALQGNAATTNAPAHPNQLPHDAWMSSDFVNLFTTASPPNTQTPLLNAVPLGQLSTPTSDDGASNSASNNDDALNSRNGAASSQASTTPQMPAGAQQVSNPYDFASQLSAMRLSKGGATGLPTPVEQVLFQMSRNLAKDGVGDMTIQLRPAELGRIDLKLSISSDGKVHGTVTADNPGTLGLLLKDVRGLERALQEAGLRADPGSLQFNLRGDGGAGQTFNQANNNGSSLDQGEGFDATTSASALLPAPVETYYLTPGGVNLRV